MATKRNATRRPQSWYLKERVNPQLGTYWQALGQLTERNSRKAGKAAYGANFIHAFPTEEALNAKLDELRKAGARII